MHRKMFRRRKGLHVFAVALQPGDVRCSHLRGKKWVLAVGFLPTSPARITKNIDIRRPDRQTVIPVAVSFFADPRVVFHPKLRRDHIGFFLQQVGIESCSQADRLGKNCGVALARSAMQPFAPPVVSGNSQPRNCGRRVHHLRRFLFQSQTRDKIIHALLDRQLGIAKRCVCSLSVAFLPGRTLTGLRKCRRRGN